MTLSADDRWAIHQTVTRADALATARDAEGYADLYTTDAVMDGAVTRAEGRPDIASAVAAVWAAETPGTAHLTANVLIDEDEPGRARVTSTLLLVRPAVEAGGTDVSTARITQVLRRTDGNWAIEHRSIDI